MKPGTHRMALLALKTLIFTALVPATVTVYLPAWLLNRHGLIQQIPDPWFYWPAALLLLTGAVGYSVCVWDFVMRGHGTPAPLDAPKNLVLSGLYRWTRNPMFLSVLLVLLAEALYFRSAGLLIYTVGTALVLHLLVVGYEEPRLRQRFGPAYADYCRTVPRWGWQQLFPTRFKNIRLR